MCVFCKLVSGEFSSYKVYEDDVCIAILDLSQATVGHTLVIPKEHKENIFEVSDDVMKHLYSVARKLAIHYKEILPDMVGVNLLNNNGEKAGQTVNHYHVHIIPRYNEDDLGDIKFVDHSKTVNYEEILNKLKMA